MVTVRLFPFGSAASCWEAGHARAGRALWGGVTARSTQAGAISEVAAAGRCAVERDGSCSWAEARRSAGRRTTPWGAEMAAFNHQKEGQC